MCVPCQHPKNVLAVAHGSPGEMVSPGNTGCAPCDFGRYRPDDNSSDCLQCPPGLVAPQRGMALCTACPEGVDRMAYGEPCVVFGSFPVPRIRCTASYYDRMLLEDQWRCNERMCVFSSTQAPSLTRASLAVIHALRASPALACCAAGVFGPWWHPAPALLRATPAVVVPPLMPT